MSRFRKFGLALAFAATMAGGVFMATPADASTLTNQVCPVLKAKANALVDLASKYPGNKLIAFLLDAANQVYGKYCS